MSTLTKQITTELAYGRVEVIRPTRADLIAALRDRADDECDTVDAALMRMAAEMLAQPNTDAVAERLGELHRQIIAKGYDGAAVSVDVTANVGLRYRAWVLPMIERDRRFISARPGRDHYGRTLEGALRFLADEIDRMPDRIPPGAYDAEFSMSVYADCQQAEPIKAPDTCPHCIDETDCSSAPICAAVADVYAGPQPVLVPVAPCDVEG